MNKYFIITLWDFISIFINVEQAQSKRRSIQEYQCVFRELKNNLFIR